MAASSRHSGWRKDEDNDRLDMYYKGTRVGHVDGCGLNVESGGVCVTGIGVDVALNCGSDLHVDGTGGGHLLLSGSANIWACTALCNNIQLLNGAGSDIFMASSCSEPSSAKGVVWAWTGDACATAPCGSAFLMITDDGCV